jgi:hypothetical protein
MLASNIEMPARYTFGIWLVFLRVKEMVITLAARVLHNVVS